jgi:DNA-binding response OmpR family regulator
LRENHVSKLQIRQPGKQKSAAVRTRKQGRVLLVEANPSIRHSLKFLLESQGYQVFIAADIAKTNSLSRFKGFAFILFNWFMEGQTGLNLCKQIREVNKATPLFFYTTLEQEDGQKMGIEAQLQGYNVKPADGNDMLRPIFVYLERNKPKPSSISEPV